MGAWPGAAIRGLDGILEREQPQWFLWLPVVFGGGIALYFLSPAEPGLLVTLAPLPAAIALRLLWRVGPLGLTLTAAFLAAALGFAAAKLRTLAVAAPVLERYSGSVEAVGWVELVEPRPGRGQRLTIRTMHIAGLSDDGRPERVRVRTMTPTGGLSPGDAVRLQASLQPPSGPALPGGYDFARTAWFSGLGAVGFASGAATRIEVAGPAPWSLRAKAAIERIRQSIGARVTAALPGETGAIANALITGERGAIPDTINDAYRDSGLFHILSISGLHMSIMAGAVFLLVRLVLAAIPSIALRHPIKKWAAVAAAFAAFAYLLISGASYATVRSWVMISIMFLAVLLDRPAVALRNVALAALAILLVYPESLLDVGFQMSFAAVVALVTAYEIVRLGLDNRGEGQRPGLPSLLALFFAGIILSTIVASLSVAPFAAYHFHKSQQYAMLANLIAIPICNMLVMPAALATLLAMPLGLEWWPLWAMGVGIDAMTWTAMTVAALPGAVGRIATIPVEAFAAMIAGGLWLLLWRTRWRLAGLLPFALGLALAPGERSPDILVGRDARLVAVRGADGRLAAQGGRGSSFDLARWLEHDGDGRSPEAAVAAGRAMFACRDAGCAAEVKGLRLAVPTESAALDRACRGAHIVVTPLTVYRDCPSAAVVIDRRAVRRHGAHALFISAGQVHVTTAARQRGQRPWSPPPLLRPLRDGG